MKAEEIIKRFKEDTRPISQVWYDIIIQLFKEQSDRLLRKDNI